MKLSTPGALHHRGLCREGRWQRGAIAAGVLTLTTALCGCDRELFRRAERAHLEHTQTFQGLRGVLLYQKEDADGARRLVVCRLESYTRIGPNPQDVLPVPKLLPFWTDLPQSEIRKHERNEIVFDGTIDWDAEHPAVITTMRSVKRDEHAAKDCS